MTKPPHTRPGSNISSGLRTRRLTLRDGRIVDVRPLQRGDREGLAAAIRRLSDQTRYLRFATAKPRLTKRELDFLVDVDHHRHEAIVAIDPITQHGVAAVRYVQVPGEADVAEIAATVADDWQGRGSAQHWSRNSRHMPGARGTRRFAPVSSHPTDTRSQCCSQPASRPAQAVGSSGNTNSHWLSRARAYPSAAAIELAI